MCGPSSIIVPNDTFVYSLSLPWHIQNETVDPAGNVMAAMASPKI